MRYRNDLIKFKKQKLEKVNYDYTHHQVYHWLSGGERRRPQFLRQKTKIRKPQFMSIDTSSAESMSEAESTDAVKRSGTQMRYDSSQHFLGGGQHPNDPPSSTP
ncbi:Hypothetical predicted protein, partial [Pelobates cultripes]